MNKRKHNSDSGSAHVIILAVIVVVIIGLLGFVFWSKFVDTPSSAPATQTATTATVPDSEIIAIENSDMNKYVNHSQGFEFLFPKEIYSTDACSTSTTRFDRFGASVPAESHYSVTSGVLPVTVLESSDLYVITAKDTIVLSQPKKIGTGVDETTLYMACNKRETTVDLINTANQGSLDPIVMTENRSFQVNQANNENDVLQLTRTIFNDKTGTITWTDDTVQTRKVVSFIHTPGPEGETGGYAYKIWYYPAEKKFVYIALGQSVAFTHPDNSDNYYLDQIVDSFKFSTK